jgi:hypothetical protein
LRWSQQQRDGLTALGNLLIHPNVQLKVRSLAHDTFAEKNTDPAGRSIRALRLCDRITF